MPTWPSPRSERLGTPNSPAIRFARGTYFGASWFTRLLRPVRLLAPLYGSDWNAQPTGASTSRLSTDRSPSPLLDMTTTATGLLCWRDFHPLEWQLASLHQNLKRNDLNIPLSAVDAVLTGDREALAKYGPPLEVIASISKAVLDAAPGHRLMKCDLSSIESRVLAAFAGETWKLAAYREFDRTSDKQLKPYCVVARKMLQKNDPLSEITAAERQIGKGGDLAGGFGGSVGAWRRLVPKDDRPDSEIKADIHAWRQAHPKTTQFWRTLSSAARLAVRTGGEHKAGPITASCRNETLYLTLPSGRSIAYPHARLTPSKFEDAPPDVMFKDNSRGAWTDRPAWFGTLVENVVQGAARDVLAAAIVRLELQGIPVVLSVHDEVVIEVPLDSPLTEDAFLALVLTPPNWAAEIPLAGKVSSGTCYLMPPDDSPPSMSGIGFDDDDDEHYEDDLADWLPSVDLPKG